MPPSPRTILFVDDETAIRRIATRLLQRAGFKVLDAADGEEGLKVWQANRAEIGLVVTDVMMPRRNGWELLDAIRAESPELPFVMTSGYDASEDGQPSSRQGVQVLGKPWEAEKLISAVNSLLP